jgi:hypothetical protein
MKKQTGIYRITSPSGAIYIGQCLDYVRRKGRYFTDRLARHPRLHVSVLSTGIETHVFEFIHECKPEELNFWERHYQDLYDACGENGLNCMLTATDEKPGKVIWAATIEKYRENGRRTAATVPWTEERKAKISKSLTGRKLSPEHIAKMVESNKGRKLSAESIQKGLETKAITVAERGFYHSEETRAKIGKTKIGNTYCLGKKLPPRGAPSDETRLKLREALKIRYQTMPVPGSKIVLNTETGVYYDTVKEAAKSIGITDTSLRARLKGRTRNPGSLIYA